VPLNQPTVTASTSLRHLRSAASGDLQVLACHTTSFGPRSFAACATKLWNSLPPSVRDPTLTLTLFCSRLKTHLFGLAYRRALVTAEAVRAARYKCSHTYTHTYITYIHTVAETYSSERGRRCLSRPDVTPGTAVYSCTSPLHRRCDLDLSPFDPKINGFPGLIVEHLYVKFGDSS